MMKQNVLDITGHSLSLQDVREVAVGHRRVAITEEADRAMTDAYALVMEIADSGIPTYGISTGFGEMSKVFISKEHNATLQKNLIRSHACAVGAPFDHSTVRAIMLLRLNTLVSGYSGVNPRIPHLLAELLNHDVVPIIPQQGSLGASGDLANLAHMALVLIGEGEAVCHGQRMDGAQALSSCGLEPVELSGKDGLALINGTPIMAGVGALAWLDAAMCYDAANAAAALSFEALHGFRSAYDARIHALRRQNGQILTAEIMLRLLRGSEYADTRSEDVQDAYTLRCVPQVHGATYDAIGYAESILSRELNAVTDNPLVFGETGDVISGGNFHGQPLALTLDFLAIAVAELADISERRTERLVNPALSGGLPAFLIENGGLNSGMMIPQYVAASLVSENKVLAHPASVDSIPSSANKEDHVSMGAIAARKLERIVSNTCRVLAIELIVAAQALDCQPRRQMGEGTEKIYEWVRSYVSKLDSDRVLSDDIERVASVLFRHDLSHIMEAFSV